METRNITIKKDNMLLNLDFVLPRRTSSSRGSRGSPSGWF